MIGGIICGGVGMLAISVVGGGVKTTRISLSIISTTVVGDGGNDTRSTSSTISSCTLTSCPGVGIVMNDVRSKQARASAFLIFFLRFRLC